MIKIGHLARQVSVLVGRRQLCLEAPINFQNSFQPKITLGTTLHLLERDYLQSNFVAKSYKSTQVKNEKSDVKQIRRHFTPEEDQKLLEHVNKHGKSTNSLKYIAKTLDRSINSLSSRCSRLLNNDYVPNTDGRRYTPEDDQKLLEYVAENGKTQSSLKGIAKILDRSIGSVEDRCRRLLSDNEFETYSDPKEWDYSDDEKLINLIFKLKKIKTNSVSSLMDIKQSEFKEIAPELQRSTGALYDHWKYAIIPYLEPHLDELATSKQLKKHLLKVIETRSEKTT